MPTRDEPWPDGTPCWADLSVPDVPAAQRFYGAVLGWEFDDSTDPQYGGYAMATVDGRSAAGMGPAQDPSAPNAWTVYVASSDADAVAAKVAEAGGTVVAGPFDVGPMGRMAIALDPHGSSFGVWQAGQHHGAGVYNAHGGLAWEEVGTTDAEASKSFYSQVFGWEFSDMEGMPGYTTFATDGAPLGGLGTPEQVGTTGWQVCFGCRDTDAVVAAATEGGGSLVFGPESTEFGR
jgi:uncharacterized protein